ncbi:major facilitator superfamily domain-containing protein [Aspergillus granulosus]|uniref:Major facilitator superfamily domain-containing protein n=1 Tax=Aspergillus granulosus TaxID=176169 RepID=A0ABR4GRX9_9EURO
MAGAFSGLLAYLIVKMDGVGSLEDWRWIFLLEGILAVVVAVASFLLVWDEQKTATFLSEYEKDILLESLTHTASGRPASSHSGNEHSSHWKHVRAAVLDWKATALYALSLFLPTIIKGLGYSSAIAQLLTTPIYAAATMTCIAVGYFADKTAKRSLFTIICYLIILIGYIIVVAPPKSIPGYHLGHSLVLAFTALGLLTTVSYYLLCKRSNSKRDEMGAIEHGYSDEELVSMGQGAHL